MCHIHEERREGRRPSDPGPTSAAECLICSHLPLASSPRAPGGGGSVEQPVPVPHPTIQASLRHLGWRRAVSWASMSSAGTWAGRVGTRGVQLYPRTQGAGAAGESPAKRGSRDGRVPGPGDALCTLAASIAAPSVQALPLASRSEEAHWPGWAAPSGLCPVGLGASGPREGGNGVRGSTGEPGPA